MCYLTGTKLFFTGSRVAGQEKKVECYDFAQHDYDYGLPDLNEGRSRHASLGFQDRFIYVFCGWSSGEEE